MKRYIFIVAAVALATVSCSRHYDVNPVSNETEAIGFGTWTENLTKAEARKQGDNTFLAGDTFAVFGEKTRASGDPTSQTVFNGDVVTASGNPVDEWNYDVPRFWDVTYDSYTFYAVSPSKVDGNLTASLDPSTGEVATSAAITFTGNDSDILVADKKVVAKGSSPYFSSYAEVPLQFNHICTLFDLMVKKHTDLTNAVVAVESITLSNMDKIGTFAVSDAYTYNHPQVTWTSSDQSASYTHASGVETVTLPTDVKTDGTDYLIHSLIAMPQTIRGDATAQMVTIKYTITPTGADTITSQVSFILKAFDTTSDDDENVSGSYISKWAPGTHYVYTITINANKIDFTVTGINDWSSAVNGYHYLIN